MYLNEATVSQQDVTPGHPYYTQLVQQQYPQYGDVATNGTSSSLSTPLHFSSYDNAISVSYDSSNGASLPSYLPYGVSSGSFNINYDINTVSGLNLCDF